MIVFDRTNKTSSASKQSVELRFEGRSVSRGVAVGRIVCLHGKKRQFYRVNLAEGETEREVRRLRAAVRLAGRQIKKLFSSERGGAAKSQANIFEAHLLILEDRSLVSKIETIIREQRFNAEWAVKVVTDGYLSIYKDIADEHLRERQVDLQDVSERILAALGGGGKSGERLEKDSILAGVEIKPSTLVELADGSLTGIVAESGGWTSHSFILARELNMPAVTGVKGFLRRVKTGDAVIVDGFRGRVIVNPSAETLDEYRSAAARFEKSKLEDADFPKGELKTLDGRKIGVCANLDIASGYRQAKRFGARGIGLFRSEFLFNQNKGFPTEAQQIEAYRKIAALAGEDGVKIRTFDLSLDQIEDRLEEREKNPALGLRAIRLSLSRKKIFRTQLRALLQASHENNIDIVLPMISDISEIIETKEMIRLERLRLEKRGIRAGKPRLGVMIEVPAAVLMADEIAAEVDFISLGTNDLVQYLLAVDRDNESVADWFKTLHPAVLKAVKRVVEAAAAAEIPAIICGEMAGSPVYAAILVGLGATDLSMNVVSMPRIRRIVSRIAFEEAREIVKGLESCKTTAEVENRIRSEFQKHWAHLFDPEMLPSR